MKPGVGRAKRGLSDVTGASASGVSPQWLLPALLFIVAGAVAAWFQSAQMWPSALQACGLLCLVVSFVPKGPSSAGGIINLRLAAVLGCAAGLLPVAAMFVGHWSAGQLWLPPWVCRVLPTVAFLSFMPLTVLAGVSLPYALASLWRGRRADAFGTLWVGGGAAVGLVLLFGTSPMMMNMRVSGFGRLGEAATPIVRAVHRFALERGRPPMSLAELVPGYLPALPPWSVRVNYYAAGQSSYELYDNPWVLKVDAGFGLGFDSFVYFPNQKYPSYLYGGGPERVGEWVYVHE